MKNKKRHFSWLPKMYKSAQLFSTLKIIHLSADNTLMMLKIKLIITAIYYI